MSRLFEALSKLEPIHPSPAVIPLTISPADGAARKTTDVKSAQPEQAQPNRFERSQETLMDMAPSEPMDSAEDRSVSVKVSPESRLVALTEPNTLGAEKFRALVTRLDNLRKQHELKSFQVTSSVVNEGKSLVAGNVAVTLAKYSGSRTLLIEGDLHRPTLSTLLGLTELHGVSQWWSGQDADLARFVRKLDGMPLWFLSAGNTCNRPSDILRSERFAKAFARLADQFEWIVVDSTPMLPIVDVNLWSRLVDGTLLVVREGVAPIKALKKGLQALDHPRLIGAVMNDVSGSDHEHYDGQYYGSS
jgi:capsular exopolysaccharide synthesis family protein